MCFWQHVNCFSVPTADVLAQAVDSLCTELKVEERRGLYIHHGGVHELLSVFRSSSVGLLTPTLIQLTEQSLKEGCFVIRACIIKFVWLLTHATRDSQREAVVFLAVLFALVIFVISSSEAFSLWQPDLWAEWCGDYKSVLSWSSSRCDRMVPKETYSVKTLGGTNCYVKMISFQCLLSQINAHTHTKRRHGYMSPVTSMSGRVARKWHNIILFWL